MKILIVIAASLSLAAAGGPQRLALTRSALGVEQPSAITRSALGVEQRSGLTHSALGVEQRSGLTHSALGIEQPSARDTLRAGAMLAGGAPGANAQGREREARGAKQLPGALRVCADPADMPTSDSARQGFANKIADLIAKSLGDTVTYAWWPSRRGYIRNTLRAEACDVVIDVPAQYELVAATKPYYRSVYVIVTRRDRHLDINSLDDPRLKTLKIGVNSIGDNYTQTPPADALSSRGISANLVWFPTFYDADHHPGDIVKAVESGAVDVAVVWGPLAGYYAKQSPEPLTIAMLPDSDALTGKQFAFDQAMGVRRSDRELLNKLNEFIDQHDADITKILTDYGVPLAPMRR